MARTIWTVYRLSHPVSTERTNRDHRDIDGKQGKQFDTDIGYEAALEGVDKP